MQVQIYVKRDELQFEDNTFLIDKYQDSLKWNDNESVLEIGPGEGKTTKSLLLPLLPVDFKEYIGVDINHRSLEYIANDIKEPKCKFNEMNIGSDQIPVEYEDRFDHIFSFFCLHWVNDPSKVAENIYKMLKPGGQFFGGFPGEGQTDELFYKLSKVPKWSKYRHADFVSQLYTLKDADYLKHWTHSLTNADLDVSVASAEKRRFTFTIQDYEDFVLSFNPLLPVLSPEDFLEYSKEYIKLAKHLKGVAHTPCTSCSKALVVVDYTLLFFVASKPL